MASCWRNKTEERVKNGRVNNTHPSRSLSRAIAEESGLVVISIQVVTKASWSGRVVVARPRRNVNAHGSTRGPAEQPTLQDKRCVYGVIDVHLPSPASAPFPASTLVPPIPFFFDYSYRIPRSAKSEARRPLRLSGPSWRRQAIIVPRSGTHRSTAAFDLTISRPPVPAMEHPTS